MDGNGRRVAVRTTVPVHVDASGSPAPGAGCTYRRLVGVVDTRVAAGGETVGGR